MYETLKNHETEANPLEVGDIISNISKEKLEISDKLNVTNNEAEKIFDEYIVESAETGIENTKGADIIQPEAQKQNDEYLNEIAVESVLEITTGSPKDTAPANTIITDGYGENLDESVNRTGIGNKIINGLGINRVISSINKHYEDKQRVLINEYKVPLKNNSISGYGNTPDPTKSVSKKMSRLITDTKVIEKLAPKLHAKNLNERQWEAQHEADREDDEERIASSELFLQEEEEAKKRYREKCENDKRMEAEIHQKIQDAELIREIEDFRKEKIDNLHAERKQEISERAFNEKLTKVEDIEIEASIDGSDVQKREVEYDSKRITVYDLKGLPFTTLLHAIDYKGRVGDIDEAKTGSAVAKQLQVDPSIWAEKKKSDIEYGGMKSDSMGDTISTSYINTEKTFRTVDKDLYYYGFDNIKPNSILQISQGDGRTYNGVGDIKKPTLIKSSTSYMPEQLEKPGTLEPYNEIQIRRYDENGDPQLPDFIVIKNGKFPELMKKHAAYFDIPVINIETDCYKQKEAERLSDLIDGVNKESDYLVIKSVLDEIDQSFLPGTSYISERNVGNGHEGHQFNGFGFYSDDLKNKFKEFSALELEKRIEYLKSRIQEETNNINEDTNNGDKHISDDNKLEIIKKSNKKSNINGQVVYNIACDNQIEINARVDTGHNRMLETTIFDGDHPNPMQPGLIWEGSNSKCYDEMSPYVDAYLSAMEQNEKLNYKLAS